MVDKLVTADWVQAHLDDPSVRLVEVDVDTEAYKESHLPGAVAFNWTTQLQDQTNRDIISKSSLDALLSAAGIDNNTHVVLYGDNNNWFAAYALWILELYGHANVSLMDGGRVKWLADGRPSTPVVPSHAAKQYRAQEPNPALRAQREEVLRAANAPGSGPQLVDLRSPAEYKGEIIAPPGMTETAQRAGHIPGAKNIPWARAVNEDGTFKSPDELRALRRGRRAGRRADDRLLPHRRALLAHLVRAEAPAGLSGREELRRLLDRVRFAHRRAGREVAREAR